LATAFSAFLTRYRMSRFSESTLYIPNSIRENETVGAEISSWVHRLDAVAKCYTADDNKEREIAVFERLCSDNLYWQRAILRYYGVLNGCVILQFACHGSIRQYLRSQPNKSQPNKPSLPIRLQWAEQATEAISFLRSKGIMHCDISCNNIFLDGQLNAMLGDFAGSSIDGEQCLGWYETSHSDPDMEDPSEKTEIFALGSTFYEILTGRKPYEGRDDVEIERAFRKGNFPNLKSLPALNTVIFNCWRGQYQTTAELLQDLKKEGTLIRPPQIFPTNQIQ
jgi:serine/threonine protein kinase